MAPAEEHSHHAACPQNQLPALGFVQPQPWRNSPHCSKLSSRCGCPTAFSAEHSECCFCQSMDHHGTRAGVINLPIVCLPEVFKLPCVGVLCPCSLAPDTDRFSAANIPSISPKLQLHQILSTLHEGGMPNRAGSATGILPNPWDGRLPPLRAIQLPVSITTASNELPNLAPLLHPGFKI